MFRLPRRRVFVDPTVQGALACRILVHWFCFLLFASLAAFVLQVLADPFQPLSEHVDRLWWTQGPLLLVILLLLPAFVADTIHVSNRFAGPIRSLRCAMREIAAGQPVNKVSFREGDFWQELAEDFNDFLLHAEKLHQDRVAPVHESNSSAVKGPQLTAAD